MRAHATRLSLAIVLSLALARCTGCDEEAAPPVTTVTAGARCMVGDVPIGTVEGIVRLADGEDEPSYPDSPFEVAHAGALPESCTPPQTRDRRPLELGEGRGLSNVGVAATGDSEHWIAAGEPVVHEVRIHDCRLDPVTITATTGDSLHLTNEITYPFMPDLGLGMLQAVLPADPLDAPVDRAGPRALECSFAAPCGRAQLLAFRSPVHTVTQEGGRFRIENAPADQELTITAWHPTIAAGTGTTRVTECGTSHVEIVVHRFEAPPPPPRTSILPGPSVVPGSVDPPPLSGAGLLDSLPRAPPTSAPPASAIP